MSRSRVVPFTTPLDSADAARSAGLRDAAEAVVLALLQRRLPRAMKRAI